MQKYTGDAFFWGYNPSKPPPTGLSSNQESEVKLWEGNEDSNLALLPVNLIVGWKPGVCTISATDHIGHTKRPYWPQWITMSATGKMYCYWALTFDAFVFHRQYKGWPTHSAINMAQCDSSLSSLKVIGHVECRLNQLWPEYNAGILALWRCCAPAVDSTCSNNFQTSL